MPEGSSNTTWAAAVGGGVCVVVLIAIVAAWAMRRFRCKMKSGSQFEGVRLIIDKSPYDPAQQVLVPTQVGYRRDSVADGMLAVLESSRRSKSAECIPLEVESYCKRVTDLESSQRKFASTTSLNFDIDLNHEESTQENFNIKRSPYVEFTLLWASSNSTFTVYVVRLTNLPPKYDGCSCSLVVKLVGRKTIVSKTSHRLRKASLNPECAEVFTFSDIDFKDLEQSDLMFEVHARRSGHLFNKVVADLFVPLSQVNLEPDMPATAMEPLSLRKKDATSERNGGRRPSDTNWGEIQVLAQYKETGSSQGRIKIVILKAQSTMVNGKHTGDYHVEVLMRKGEETQVVNVTKAAFGLRPVWNAPFIFDVTQEKVSEYWIELNLIRMGWTKRKATLGQAFLGLGTTPRGSQHWQSITECPGREVTLWHPVVQEE